MLKAYRLLLSTRFRDCQRHRKQDHETDHQNNDRGTLRSLIQNTDGYYLGNYARCNLNENQNMVYVPVDDFPYTIKTVAVFNKKRKVSKEEKAFLDFLQEIYDEKM